MEPFDYGEGLTFDHVRRRVPAVRAAQLVAGGRHTAALRARVPAAGGEAGAVELTLAHPLGLTEVADGGLLDGRMDLASTTMGRTTTGMAVVAVTRRYRIDGDEIAYEPTWPPDHPDDPSPHRPSSDG